MEDIIKKIVNIYSKYIDEELDMYMGNRYLLIAVENLIHETKTGFRKPGELQKIATKLRDALLEGPGNVNPYIMEVLGILEEEVTNESIEEALELSRKLFKEDRFDKIEV